MLDVTQIPSRVIILKMCFKRALLVKKNLFLYEFYL